MYCRKCGKQISENAEYCSYCGVQNLTSQTITKHPAINSRNQPADMKSASNQRWGIWIGIIAFVVVVFLIVWIAKQNRMVLTVEEAQSKMDTALEDIYQESSPDNYIMQALKEKVVITVDSIQSTEDGCLAKCTVKSIDIATPILNYLLGLDDDAVDTYSNVVTELQKEIAGANEIQQTFLVKFIQVDDEYTAMLPEEMVVFCSGNIQDLLPKLYEILQGGTIE